VDLLDALLGHILREIQTDPFFKVRVVVLGDYVDRGPASPETLDLLIASQKIPEFGLICLKGNHEAALLDFLHSPETGPTWCAVGGRETLLAYGVAPPVGRGSFESWCLTAEALQRALPSAHRDFLTGLPTSFEIEDFIFVHAGLRPGLGLEVQSDEDKLWIRQTFLNDHRTFEKVVVHGHSPKDSAYSDRRRIGVDTGAYATGILSAACLENQDRALIQAVRQGSEINIRKGLFPRA
jgi:serine/threonine protein phosphatase 1